MNRGYSKEQYLDLAKRIKERIPDAYFTTDPYQIFVDVDGIV